MKNILIFSRQHHKERYKNRYNTNTQGKATVGVCKQDTFGKKVYVRILHPTHLFPKFKVKGLRWSCDVTLLHMGLRSRDQPCPTQFLTKSPTSHGRAGWWEKLS